MPGWSRQGRQVYSITCIAMMIFMNFNVSGHFSHPVQLRHVACVSLLLLVLITMGACGNKGPLYLDPDPQSLAELEQAEREINEAAQLPDDQDNGNENPPSEDDQNEESEEEVDEDEEDPKQQPGS